MKRIRGSHPSPAIIVAVAALIAALAGTAVAEEATTSAKPVTKKKVKKIADKRIDKAAPGLTVGNSELLDGLDSTEISPAAFAHTDGFGALSSSFVTVLSAQITTTGTTLVGSASAEGGATVGDDDEYTCRATINGNPVTDYSQNIPDAQGFDTDVLSFTFGGTVGAGTHTVALSCLEGAGSVSLGDADLTVSAHI